MSLAFLTPSTHDGAPPAESPFTAAMAAAGAQFTTRHGWSVPTGFGTAADERHALAHTTAWTDASHLGVFEVQVAESDIDVLAASTAAIGSGLRASDAWWCLLTPVRMLVISEAAASADVRGLLEGQPGFHVVDVTTQYAGLRLAGPDVRELFARFCALDLRPKSAALASVIPGSVARTPSVVVREDDDQFLWLMPASYATYVWNTVTDAGKHLGGHPVGIDLLTVPTKNEEAGTHA